MEAAREAFGPAYYDIVCEARILEEGTYQSLQVSTVYRKNSRYRIERCRVGRSKDAPQVEQLRKHISQGDVSALEAWVGAKQPCEVSILEGSWQTTVRLDAKGQLKKQKNRIGALNV